MTYNDIIRKKRDGGVLSRDEIEFLIKGVVNETIPDYQLSAFLMAVYFKGMTPEETAIFTDSMAKSGDTLNLSVFKGKSCDKHSTGGVGDKTSLIVAPTVAVIGGMVAKMSGRALGHTGGTVDKLESIPGYKTELSPSEFLKQVENIGIAVIAQSKSFAPADKTMYALRDVTSTIESMPLIASSIMSKKLAAGAENIVLDVKVGSGAFMKDKASALELAKTMKDIGVRCGRNVRAVLTDMDRPLGNAIGNVLEVKEAIEVLNGGGPDDLRMVCITLSGLLASMMLGISDREGIELACETLASGKSYDKFTEWIKTQGGDIRYVQAPELFGEAHVKLEVKAEKSGYISHMDTDKIGLVSAKLGSGRQKKDDKIDPLAGIILYKKTGDHVKSGEVMACLHTSTPELAELGRVDFLNSIKISLRQPNTNNVIIEIV